MRVQRVHHQHLKEGLLAIDRTRYSQPRCVRRVLFPSSFPSAPSNIDRRKSEDECSLTAGIKRSPKFLWLCLPLVQRTLDWAKKQQVNSYSPAFKSKHCPFKHAHSRRHLTDKQSVCLFVVVTPAGGVSIGVNKRTPPRL